MIDPPLQPRLPEPQRKIYSISELSAAVRELLERRFIDIWVEGEISNFKTSTAGHLYFTLKDERAQLAAVCFKNTARLLRFRPENGRKFRARGRIGTYEARGEYQLIVEVLEPAGLGALQLAFDQLKQKLEKEGLFSADRKRPIPPLPRKIGIVTSPKGAALHDVLTVLKRRHNNVDVLIYPSEVQGAGAAAQIAEGIDYLAQHTDVDVIVIARGGGSMEDLWSFNEERVARAIARSPKPVISAVGHEVDFTIADFVADLRAPTPSAAAEIVSQSKAELRNRIAQLEGRLENHMRLRLRKLAHFLATKVGSRGFTVAEAQLRRLSQRVDDLGFRLERLAESGALVAARRRRVEVAENGLARAVQERLKKWQNAFARAAHTLDAISPLRVLDRGYAICVGPDGAVVRSAGAVAVDAAITVRLREGTLQARVTGKQDGQGKHHAD